jgi:hypothetical protein
MVGKLRQNLGTVITNSRNPFTESLYFIQGPSWHTEPGDGPITVSCSTRPEVKALMSFLLLLL